MNKLAASDKKLVEGLKKNLSNTTLLYHQAHGYHWNLIGTDFPEYHALFELIYSDLYDAIDPFAENIRKVGGVSPFLLKDFISLSSLTERDVKSFDANKLSKLLYDDNKKAIGDLKELFILCNDQNEQGLANFVAGRIDMQQKWQWQLGASLGMKDVTEGK